MMLSISPATERNQQPIFEVVSSYVKSGLLFEMGSGNGQHAAFFTEKLPELRWQSSDRAENLPAILAWKEESKRENFLSPVEFEIGKDSFPEGKFDYIFTANTLHIMSWKLVKTFLKQVGKAMDQSALLFIYGPFNYNAKFTSESNESFNQWLKDRDPVSGIRNFEDIEANLKKYEVKLLKDHEMPANNRLLVFKKL